MSPALAMIIKEIAVIGITEGIRAFRDSGQPAPQPDFAFLRFELGQIAGQIEALDFQGPVWDGG